MVTKEIRWRHDPVSLCLGCFSGVQTGARRRRYKLCPIFLPQEQGTTVVAERRVLYAPLVSRQEAVTQAVDDIIERFFDGSVEGLVLKLLEGRYLTAESLEQIRNAGPPCCQSSYGAGQGTPTPIQRAPAP